MSGVHVEEHSSLIKTPQQLIVVVLLAFLFPVIGIVMIASFATGGLKVDDMNSEANAVAERLKPVGTVVIGEVPAEPGGTASVSGGPVKTAAAGGPGAGKKLYDTVCMACHAAGIAGAPKTGDKAAWAPHIAKGKDSLYNSALHGKNAMPAKGGLASVPDADVKAAVDYLVSQAK
ncbi:MAG TPA: c-type cytochrome [Burkholderiales bacterium]|nr:c-type cytochrome [Burkholderiales bacterium]